MEESNHSEQQAQFELDDKMQSETTVSDHSSYSEDGSDYDSDYENMDPHEVDMHLHDKYPMVAKCNVDPKDYYKLADQLDGFLNDFECATGIIYHEYRKTRSWKSK